jgi:integrase
MRYFPVSGKPTFFGTQVGTQNRERRTVYQKTDHIKNICVPKTRILGTKTHRGIAMPKLVKPLTDNQCKHAKPKDKQYTLSHGGGMGLRVMPSGKKEWILRYTKPYTTSRTAIQLGIYPATTMKKAQNKRDQYLAMLADNKDPLEVRTQQQAKAEQKKDNTFKHVAELWMEDKQRKAKANPQTAKDIWNSLENHIFPKLGQRPIDELRPKLVAEVIKPLETKGSLELVKRLCQRINEVMAFALNEEIITDNPLAHIKGKFKAPTTTHHPALETNELPALMAEILSANIAIPTRLLIEWQLHTMVRPLEAARTKWSEIDFTSRTRTIPKERMKKVGTSKQWEERKAHVIPLSAQALSILKQMKPFSGHLEYVFPNQRDRLEHASSDAATKAFNKMGLRGKQSAHGMRTMASSTLNEAQFNADVIEAALYHLDPNEQRRTYNRTDYFNQRRIMMDWWSARIESASNGTMEEIKGNHGLRAVN